MKNDFLFLFIGRFKVRSVPGMQNFFLYVYNNVGQSSNTFDQLLIY